MTVCFHFCAGRAKFLKVGHNLLCFVKGLSGTAVVQLSYRGGLNAENGQDYIKGPDAVAFAAGQKVEEIVVQILPDRLPELKETLVVRLDR